jgi:MFS superfamily sulfate permease-like transporter
MSAAAESVVLLIMISVIRLPVFVPPTALTSNESSYDMNREFFVYSVSNLLAKAVRTVLNLVVLPLNYATVK